jgi:hypothetical protein
MNRIIAFIEEHDLLVLSASTVVGFFIMMSPVL